MNIKQYIAHHRSLVEQGIRSNPKQFKPQDLHEFDAHATHAVKLLKEQRLLEGWAPVVTLTRPEQFFALSEEQIICETYLGKGSWKLLTEQSVAGTGYSAVEIQNETNAALQSQLQALIDLTKFWQGVQKKVEESGEEAPEELSGFQDELADIKKELDGIYGKLNSSGALGWLGDKAKRGFGFLQRGMGKLFGAGTVQKEGLDEVMTAAQAAAFRPGMTPAGFDAAGGVGVPTDLSQWLLSAPRSASRHAHNIGKAVFGKDDWATTAGKLVKGGGDVVKGAVDPSGATMTALKGAGKTASITAMKAGGAAAGVSTGAAVGIGAGIGALIAAGAAGAKMGQRRRRLENLVKLQNNFMAGGSPLAQSLAAAGVKPVVDNMADNSPAETVTAPPAAAPPAATTDEPSVAQQLGGDVDNELGLRRGRTAAPATQGAPAPANTRFDTHATAGGQGGSQGTVQRTAAADAVPGASSPEDTEQSIERGPARKFRESRLFESTDAFVSYLFK